MRGAIVLTLSLLMACHGGSANPTDSPPDTSQPPPQGEREVRALIVDPLGQPISGATFAVGDRSTVSDDGGVAILPAAVGTIGAAEKPGYAAGFALLPVQSEGPVSARVVLTPQSSHALVEPSVGGAVQLGALGLSFPPGGVAGAGPVVLYAAVASRAEAVPSGLRALTPSGQAFALRAAIAFDVSLGDGATLTAPVAFDLSLPNASARLALYEFNPTDGYWHLSTQAVTIDSDGVHGDLPHFSWWAIGQAAEETSMGCLAGQLNTATGPAAAAQVAVSSVDSLDWNASLTETDGSFCLAAPTSEAVRVSAWGWRADGTTPWTWERELVMGQTPGVCGGDCEELGAVDVDSDPGTEVDADADGYTLSGDCDDANPIAHPGADERCNGVDDDCDGVVDDFCDCVFVGYADVPQNGIDEDCDGSDASSAVEPIYVSATSGRALGAGSAVDPVATLGQALSVAAANPARTWILVETGTYTESVQLREGLNYLGGFNSDFSHRDPTQHATIQTADDGPTLVLSHVRRHTSIEGFHVVGPTAHAGSVGSIGLWVEDASDALHLRNNVITARSGFHGAPGADGLPGSDGADGQPGISAAFVQCGGLASVPNGGVTVCGAETTVGGDGGGQSCPVRDGSTLGGADGLPSAVGGVGGEASCVGGVFEDSFFGCVCDLTCGMTGGASGSAGATGQAGSGGLGGDALGRFARANLGGWLPSAGSAGGSGGVGGGGGGGSAGASSQNFCSAFTEHQMGGTGGGGGAGGCNGGVGAGGGGGGASFGLVLFDIPTGSWPVVVDNVVQAGDGGDGGAGGDGARGGDGGVGGLGGSEGDASFDAPWCVRAGGDGGMGGPGGAGGGGGGGGGGSSYAVIAVGSTPPVGYVSGTNTLSYGLSGAGGAGGLGGAGGSNGATGQAGAVSWQVVQ